MNIKPIFTRTGFTFILLVVTTVLALGQMDFNRQYQNARDLFQQKKYNLAMESFKPLIAYDSKNPYAEYASYYYALSAFHQGYKAVAKDMLNQVKTTYPKWEKMDEVNFLLGRIYFDNKDYFQGLKTFDAIQNKTIAKDIESVKLSFINNLSDVETLRMMNEEYPKDEVIGKAFARVLSKNVSSAEDKKLLESLIAKYNLNRSEFISEVPKSVTRERYAVSVMLPFMVNSLEPTASKKKNQILIDFYEGMKLAADTLATQGVNISLRAYDTERSPEKVKRLLGTEELRSADLIVGPFFPEEVKTVAEFSAANKVNMVHPFSNSSDLIQGNDYGFLFQPSSETIGKKVAEFLATRSQRKNTMVFYGTGKRDSTLAEHFIRSAREKGMKVISSKRLSNKEAGKILEILATPTEFDEFKYPKQFTLKKDSIGSIYVATDDPLLYSKVVSGVETRGDSIQVVGSEGWLDDLAIPLEKFQTQNLVLTSPNYVDPNRGAYKTFFNHFVQRYGRTPSNFSKMGYEFMLFFGNQLKSNGVYFQEALNQKGFIPGYITEGFNYQSARNNQLVPFITFTDGDFSLVDKR